MIRTILPRAALVAGLAAPFAVAAAVPASAACQAPDVVVTHTDGEAQAHVIRGCNIRVELTGSAYGALVGPWKSGNSYSVIIRTDLDPAHGGWDQDVNGKVVRHATF